MAAEVLGRDFTQVSNQLFRDPRIHAKSKGIFGFLASHRDGFGVSPESIAAASADGISAVKSALRELEQYGYLTRSQTRTTDGLMGDTTYRITDMPSSEPVDGNRPAVPTCDDAETRRSEPVDGKPPADEPPADDHPHKKTIPSKEISSEEKTTSSSPDDAPAENGGGGGDLSSRAIATEITAELDYRGRQPDKRQRQTITDRLTAALDDDWTIDALAVHLDLGTAPVNYAAGVYMHRLQPEILDAAKATLPSPRSSGGTRGPMPTAEDYANATLESVLGDGTDSRWGQAATRARMAVGYRPFECPPASAYTRGFGAAYKPYSNDPWSAPADPAEAAKIPHCGEWECDPVSRRRDFDTGNGLKTSMPCEKCHPSMRF